MSQTPPPADLVALSEKALREACRVVAASAGEDFDSLGQFTQETIRGTQHKAISAYLRNAPSRPSLSAQAVGASSTSGVRFQLVDRGEYAVALLREVVDELVGIGSEPCLGSHAPVEDLHARIDHFLMSTTPPQPADGAPCIHQWQTTGGGGEAHRSLACTKCGRHRDHLPNAHPADGVDRVGELVEVIKLALEYWNHRQRRYKNRFPVWVQEANAALAKFQPAGGES